MELSITPLVAKNNIIPPSAITNERKTGMALSRELEKSQAHQGSRLLYGAQHQPDTKFPATTGRLNPLSVTQYHAQPMESPGEQRPHFTTSSAVLQRNGIRVAVHHMPEFPEEFT
jgi:hypothetical protein